MVLYSYEIQYKVRMAEWSKALRLGRSIFGCVSLDPTHGNFSIDNLVRTVKRKIPLFSYTKRGKRNKKPN